MCLTVCEHYRRSRKENEIMTVPHLPSQSASPSERPGVQTALAKGLPKGVVMGSG